MTDPGRHPLPPPTHVDLEGTTTATYVLEPSRSGPVSDVVLCHGTPWSAAVWAPVAHALRQDHRVRLWDMPGYGASIGTSGSAVDLESQRRRFATLLDRWGLDRPHVIAHDIGGAVALGAHLLEATEYASVYLLDIVTLDPWGSPFFRLVAEHESVFSALPPSLHAALVREYISGAAPGLDPDWIDELAGPWVTEAGTSAFYSQIAQLTPAHTRPIAERLGDVHCPVRIGWGDQDPWIPPEQATELARRLPHSPDVTHFAGAGHLVPLEAAEELTTVLLGWLRHVEAT